MGPTVTPWSMGTMTVRPVSRFMMRSMRICLPTIFGSFRGSLSISGATHGQQKSRGRLGATAFKSFLG